MDKERNLPPQSSSETSSHPAKKQDSAISTPHPARSYTKLSLILSFIALISSSVTGYFFYHYDKRPEQQTTVAQKNLIQQVAQLHTQLTETQQQIKQTINSNQNITQQLKQQTSTQNELESNLQQFQSQLTQYNIQFKQLQQQMMTSAGLGSPQQRLIQIESILAQATLQIWFFQQPAQAISLLNIASQSLTELQLDNTQPIITAITQEISVLRSMPTQPVEKGYSALQELNKQIDSLTLKSATTAASSHITSSVTDWKSNLWHSWHGILHQLINIQPKNSLTHCLKSATSSQQQQQCHHLSLLNQSDPLPQLQQNLRNQLLIATQALLAHQPSLFKQSLEQCDTLVQQAFNTAQPSTQQFLTELTTLQNMLLFPQLSYPLESSQKLHTLLEQQFKSSGSNIINTQTRS